LDAALNALPTGAHHYYPDAELPAALTKATAARKRAVLEATDGTSRRLKEVATAIQRHIYYAIRKQLDQQAFRRLAGRPVRRSGS
jgi:hypothetical protein